LVLLSLEPTKREKEQEIFARDVSAATRSGSFLIIQSVYLLRLTNVGEKMLVIKIKNKSVF